jgi:hypothetical protein
MAIDDPLDASDERIKAEVRTDSPLRRFIPRLADLSQAIPVPSFLKDYADLGKSALQVAAGWINQVEQDRQKYLIDSLKDELRRVRGQLEDHLRSDKEAQDFSENEFLPLVLDGLQKAEQTRSRKRIAHIAAILAHSLQVGRVGTGDIVEEMMRIAMLLSDEDVVVLREIFEAQKPHFNPRQGRTDFEHANDFWRSLDPTNRSISDPKSETIRALSPGNLDSVCVKLQSLGLLAQVPRNNMKLAPGVTPYALLAKGVQFVEYIGGFGS